MRLGPGNINYVHGFEPFHYLKKYSGKGDQRSAMLVNKLVSRDCTIAESDGSIACRWGGEGGRLYQYRSSNFFYLIFERRSG